jgi:ketosteroid isomerase-like protein
LVQIENAWLRAVEQHDTATLGCILADELEEADFAGSLISRSEMLASAENRGDVHYELSEVHAHVYGDFAYVRGMGVASAGGQPTVKSRFTDIFLYREGRWQCVAGHESHFPNS